MSESSGRTPPQGIKVGLKRLNLEDRVFGDEDLRRSPFVSAVGEARMRELLAQAVGKRFADQARIFLEGDSGDALVFMLRGEARLLVGKGAAAAEVTVVRKGEVMGEREALGETAARAFSAQALGEVELLEFPKDVIAQLTNEQRSVAEHLRQLSKSRCAAGEELAEFLNRW